MEQFSTDQKKLTSAQLGIQCPYCFQVFKTFKHEFEEDKPDFQCSVCQGQFWINSRDTEPVILGRPMDMEKNADSLPMTRLGTSTKICPRCTEEVPMEDQECSYCGVVFIKMIEGMGASFQLRGIWANVIKNWHDENAHDEFLRICHKQSELVYGISCYGRVLKEDKENKKAKEMIQRMESLTWFFEEEIALPKLTFRDTFHRKLKGWIASHAFDALMLAITLCILVYIFI